MREYQAPFGRLLITHFVALLITQSLALSFSCIAGSLRSPAKHEKGLAPPVVTLGVRSRFGLSSVARCPLARSGRAVVAFCRLRSRAASPSSAFCRIAPTGHAPIAALPSRCRGHRSPCVRPSLSGAPLATRSRPAPSSRPRPQTPSAPCANNIPGCAVAFSAQVGRAARAALPARPVQAAARALSVALLSAFAWRRAERAPFMLHGAVALVASGSACSLAYGLPTILPLRAPNSRPRPQTPSAPCANNIPGCAVAFSAQVGQAVRTSLPARPLQAAARALPALILPAVGTRQAERAPFMLHGAVALVASGSACSLTGAPLPPSPRGSLRSRLPPCVFRFGLACVLAVTVCGMRPRPVAFSLSIGKVVAAAASGSRSPFARLAFRGRAP